MQILLEVYEKMQLPMTGKETGKLFSEKRQIVEIAQKICRKKEHAVDDCGKRHGFSTRKRDKKREKRRPIRDGAFHVVSCFYFFSITQATIFTNSSFVPGSFASGVK